MSTDDATPSREPSTMTEPPMPPQPIPPEDSSTTPKSTAHHHNSGWIPDLFDERDKAYSYRGAADDPAYFKGVNLLKSHPEWLHNIYVQGASKSCVANATAAALRYLAHKLGISGLVLAPS